MKIFISNLFLEQKKDLCKFGCNILNNKKSIYKLTSIRYIGLILFIPIYLQLEAIRK